ncbi:DUF1465 family protein [Sphingomonas bacterium]|uniref:DUF1465 family protein n=1 Tax=Sphingomonas bacterium TaxID=1895847 RepID=UPI0015760FFA|nr:DUF1465 family protein [Sphingomonas bacterium]
MNGAFTESRVQRRLHDALYVEAMLIADEARSYFDDDSRVEREALPPMARVAFSCESLKVTTRLMHAIAWLLTQRAVAAGELRACEALDPARRLGTAPMSDAESLAEMPTGARRLIDASIDLHRRVARLDALQEREMAAVSPARSMQERLALAF